MRACNHSKKSWAAYILEAIMSLAQFSERWLQSMTVSQKTYGNFVTGVATICTVFSSLSKRTPCTGRK
jgi:hypothetical protein